MTNDPLDDRPDAPPGDPYATLERTRHKGRGSVSNASGRFEPETRHREPDGWGTTGDSLLSDEETAPALRTILGIDSARTIITTNDSPDVPFTHSINPYRGCEHGCIYCFARPTHAYLGLSPGLDFETRIFFKPEAGRLLRQALSRPSYRPVPIALGTNTDPYQPIEREKRVTRRILEVLAEARHPVGIVTKSALVTRDIDILAPMAAARLARVCLSVTTLDRHLARRMEPRASTPELRLAAMGTLKDAGVPVSVLSSPMIPGLNDHEMEAILERAAAVGADQAGYILLRLPLEIKDLFREWLEAHFPDRAARIFSLMRQTRDGKVYDATWGKRMRGTGPYADLIARRFEQATRRLGLNQRRWEMRTDLFRRPDRDPGQLRLFE